MSNPWDQKESEDRLNKFINEYRDLVEKYKCELVAFPQYVPSGHNGFNTSASIVPIDLKNKPVRSPLQDDPIIK